MHEWSVLLLRGALVLYSLGLWHSLVTVVKRRQEMFRTALLSISVGALVHLSSIVLYGISMSGGVSTVISQRLAGVPEVHTSPR